MARPIDQVLREAIGPNPDTVYNVYWKADTGQWAVIRYHKGVKSEVSRWDTQSAAFAVRDQWRADEVLNPYTPQITIKAIPESYGAW